MQKLVPEQSGQMKDTSDVEQKLYCTAAPGGGGEPFVHSSLPAGGHELLCPGSTVLVAGMHISVMAWVKVCSVNTTLHTSNGHLGIAGTDMPCQTGHGYISSTLALLVGVCRPATGV